MPTNIFRGDAAPQFKQYTLTPADPEPGDIFRVTINGKSVQAVAASGNVAELVAALIAAINDSTIAEYQEVTASGTEVLIITAVTAGVDIFVTAESIDVGSAAGFEIEVTTVTAGDPGVNEIQRVSIPAATSGGTFTLTFQGEETAAIAYDASAATIQTALEALSNIAAGDVSVGGASPTWTVEFQQAYANVNVPLLTGDGSSLTGAGSIGHETIQDGSPGVNEIKSWNSAVHLTEFGAIYKVLYGGVYSGAISSSASASVVQEALEDVFGAGNVVVSRTGSSGDYTYTVEFVGDQGSKNIGSLFISDTAGTSTIVSDTDQEGSATSTDEIQDINIFGSPTSGSFTLTFQGQTTAAIDFDATAAELEAALEALSNIDNVSVEQDGNNYRVTFGGSLAGTDVAQITSDASGLVGAAITVVTTQAATEPANEVQQIQFPVTPSGGTYTLTWDPGTGDETTAAIDFDATAAEVQTALEGLATPAGGDFSVTGEEGGPWLVEFTGSYAETDVNPLSGTSSLTGSGAESFVLGVSGNGGGSEHWNDATNWTLNQVPETGDDVVLEQGSTNIRYGLRQIQDFTADNSANLFTTSEEHDFVADQKVRVRNSGGALPTGLSAATDYYLVNVSALSFQLSASRGGSAVAISDDGTGTHTLAVELNSFKQYSRYSGQIGLPLRNENDYYEHRPRWLKIGLLSSGNQEVKIGVGEGQGSGFLRLDFDVYEVAGVVQDTAGGIETDVPALLVENTNTSSVWTVKDGEVGFAFFTGTTGNIGTLIEDGGSIVLGDGMTISTKIQRTAGELLSIGEVSINGTIEISG